MIYTQKVGKKLININFNIKFINSCIIAFWINSNHLSLCVQLGGQFKVQVNQGNLSIGYDPKTGRSAIE